MFRAYLSDKPFPIVDFVQEMDKRELLFFFYLSTQKDNEDILESVGKVDDIDHFYRIAQKVVGSRFNKLSKERVVDEVVQRLQKRLPSTMVYSSVYDYNFEKDFVIFSKQLLAIERLVTIQFLKKIKRVVQSGVERSISNSTELENLYLFENKPILNTLGLTMLIAKIDATQDSEHPKNDIDELRESLIMIFYKQFLNKEIEQRLYSEELLRKKDLLIEKVSKEATKKEELFKKTKEKCSQLTKELKEIEKDKKKKIQDSIKQIEQEKEEKYKAEVIRLETVVESLRQELKSHIEREKKRLEENTLNLKNEIKVLKEKEKEYLSEINQYKRKVSAFESKSLETTLREYLKEQELPKEVSELLREQLVLQDVSVRDDSVEVEIKHKIEQRIGYCQIEEDKHFVTFANGEKLEIQNIPESTYIGENQFVKVDASGAFKYIFGYHYVPSERDYQIVDFGSIIYKGSEPFMIKAIWDERKIENLSSHIHLRDSQVISVNGRGELVRFYGTVQHNADNYMKSIQAKGQEAYYVMKSFPNGMMLRSLSTGEETFQEIDLNGYEVKEQEILCVKDNQVVHVYRSPRFYTHSSYYKKAQTGVAEIQEDKVFIRKLSGEIVIVNDIPARFSILDGDTLVVDENANFITVKKEKKMETPVERKRMGISKQTAKKRSERIKIEREVLIVGKITYENSYKMAFFKNGYRAEVIDGYEPWNRIRSSLKDKDAVVVVSDFISHDNMFRLKDEGLDIPLLFPEYDGANRILEEVEAIFEANRI